MLLACPSNGASKMCSHTVCTPLQGIPESNQANDDKDDDDDDDDHRVSNAAIALAALRSLQGGKPQNGRVHLLLPVTSFLQGIVNAQLLMGAHMLISMVFKPHLLGNEWICILTMK